MSHRSGRAAQSGPLVFSFFVVGGWSWPAQPCSTPVQVELRRLSSSPTSSSHFLFLWLTERDTSLQFVHLLRNANWLVTVHTFNVWFIYFNSNTSHLKTMRVTARLVIIISDEVEFHVFTFFLFCLQLWDFFVCVFVCLIRLVQSQGTEQNLQSFGFAYCVPHKTERARVGAERHSDWAKPLMKLLLSSVKTAVCIVTQFHLHNLPTEPNVLELSWIG